MSKMKSMLGMYAMGAMMSAGMYTDPTDPTEPIESDEDQKLRLSKSKAERNKAKGLKEFFYGENTIWAINQKNADRKARKKNWL